MTYISSEGTTKDDPIPKGKEEKPERTDLEGTSGRKDKDKKETGRESPLLEEPICDFYLPLMGNPKATDFPVIRKEITPMGGSVGRVIEVPFWEEMFGTRFLG